MTEEQEEELDKTLKQVEATAPSSTVVRQETLAKGENLAVQGKVLLTHEELDERMAQVG